MSKFIAYVDLTDSREISPKYSEDNEKQKCVLEKEPLKKGSALKVTTLCKNSHSKEWVSQPLVNRAAAGNVLLSGAILFTENTFLHVSEIASTINLAFLSKSDYHKRQKKHLFPVINDLWQQ